MSNFGELKPCPFCGSEAYVVVFSGEGVAVKCTECGIGTEFQTDNYGSLSHGCSAITEVMELWNKRVGDCKEAGEKNE